MSPVRSLERRQITVLFCDVVGWSLLAHQVGDPEELTDPLSAYRDRCATIVARHEGFVAEYTGDGVLVFFGYPKAHEDAAERAIRAALDIIKRDDGHRRSPRSASASTPAASSSCSMIRGQPRRRTPLNGAPRSPPSASRSISRLGFRRWRKPAPLSCRSKHIVCAAGSSNTRTSGAIS